MAPTFFPVPSSVWQECYSRQVRPGTVALDLELLSPQLQVKGYGIFPEGAGGRHSSALLHHTPQLHVAEADFQESADKVTGTPLFPLGLHSQGRGSTTGAAH